MTFEIYLAKNDEWRWRLKADNGEIIASGESYQRYSDCLHAIDVVKASSKADLFTIGVLDDGLHNS